MTDPITTDGDKHFGDFIGGDSPAEPAATSDYDDHHQHSTNNDKDDDDDNDNNNNTTEGSSSMMGTTMNASPPAGDDPFGSYKTVEKNATTSDDGQTSDGCGSTLAPESVMNASTLVHVDSDDDGFGDFGGFSGAPSEESVNENKGDTFSNADGGSGMLDSATPAVMNQGADDVAGTGEGGNATDTYQSASMGNQDEDDFGAFGSATSPIEVSPPADKNTTTTDEATANAETDPFGDFGSVPAPTVEITAGDDGAVVETQGSEEVDFFGDFEVVPVSSAESAEGVVAGGVGKKEDPDEKVESCDNGTDVGVLGSSSTLILDNLGSSDGPVKVDTGDDEKVFADVESAPEPAVQIPRVPSSDEGFRDSDNAQVSGNDAPNVELVAGGNADTSELAPENGADEKGTSASHEEDHDNGKGDGGFDSAAPATTETVDDSFPIGDGTAPDTVGAEVKKDTPIENADDDFGGFGSATPATTETVDNISPTGVDKKDTPIENTDDDFGDFGGFDSARPGTTDPANDSPPTGDGVAPDTVANEGKKDTPVDKGDDDFGDFGGFDSARPGTTDPANDSSPTGDGVAPDTVANEGKKDTPVDKGDDDFGDSGGFDSARPATTDPVNDSSPVEDGVAPATVDNEVKRETPMDSGDDDFGDFGGFEGADAPPEQPVSNVPSNQRDDDFGEFGAFDGAPHTGQEPAPSAPVEKVDEDEFGDFGGFEGTHAAPAQPQETVSPKETVVEGDDFGDFGDFDTAPAPTDTPGPVDAETGDEFGDFSDHDTAPAEANTTAPGPNRAVEGATAAVPGSTNSQESSPVFIANVRSKFPLLFERFLPSINIQEEEDGTTGPEAVTLDSLLKSASKGSDARIDGMPSQLLHVFEELSVCKAASPREIIAHGAKGPYAHFAFPVGGIQVESGSQNNSGGRRESAAFIPDASKVRLPSPEKAAEMKPPVSVAVTPSGSNGPSSQNTANVMLLVKQIPDLSFMLSSKLSLPRDETAS